MTNVKENDFGMVLPAFDMENEESFFVYSTVLTTHSNPNQVWLISVCSKNRIQRDVDPLGCLQEGWRRALGQDAGSAVGIPELKKFNNEAFVNDKNAWFDMSYNRAQNPVVNNVILMGDSVGTGHYCTSGGFHISMIFHSNIITNLFAGIYDIHIGYENP